MATIAYTSTPAVGGLAIAPHRGLIERNVAQEQPPGPPRFTAEARGLPHQQQVESTVCKKKKKKPGVAAGWEGNTTY